jgi:hypothetical protein
MGDLHLLLGDASAAALHYAVSHPLVVARVEQDPDNARAQRTLSFSHYRVATASLFNGDAMTAQQHYRECLTLRQKLALADPRNTHKQIDLMVALARCGQHADAATVAANLGARASQDPSVLFQIACGYSLCIPAVAQSRPSGELVADQKSQQEQYLARALDAVREAIARGYRDHVALEHDPDLRPLQSRPDFQALVGSLK